MSSMELKEKLRNEIAELLKKVLEEINKGSEVELIDSEIEIESLEFSIQPLMYYITRPEVKPEVKVIPEIERVEYKVPEIKWVGSIKTVKIGATKEEGGTREITYVLGGQKCPQLYAGLTEFHKPIVSMDVFDIKVSLPKSVRQIIGEDVLENPAEWAKLCVEKFNADMVSVHLISTDPKVMDRSPKEAAKVLEEVLQAVKTPIFVGGSGNPKKDTEVLKEIAERFAGERLLLSPITLDMKLEDIAPVIKKYNQVAVASVTMNIDQARQLTRKLMTWLSPNDIVVDHFTAGIGYGWEYAFSTYERAILAALHGDEELQFPTVAAASNAWSAREAWMKMDPFWGPKEYRGPLWEILTALTFVILGVDLILTLHPLTVKYIKEFINKLSNLKPSTDEIEMYYKWSSVSTGV